MIETGVDISLSPMPRYWLIAFACGFFQRWKTFISLAN
jgi:hypothetical protein